MIMKTLHSVNLTLRPFEQVDIPELSQMLADPEIARYLFSGTTLSAAQAETFINSHFASKEDDEFGMGTIVERATEKFVGFAGLIQSSYLDGNDLELGFAIARNAQGKKYGKEIGKRQIVFGFDELKCRRLLGLVHPQNYPSHHILEANLKMRLIEEIEIPGRGPREVFSLERATYLETSSYYCR